MFFLKKITNLSKYPGKIKRIRIQIQENVDGTRIHIQEMCSTIQDANLGKIKRIQIKSFLFDLGCPIDSAESMLTAVRDSAESDCAMKGH